jgi:cell division protein ZapD
VEESKICYDNPLNERVRTMLRLEFMFKQLAYAFKGDAPWDARNALNTYFDTYNLVTRNEIKSDLLQELDRHHTNLSRLGERPGVDPTALKEVLKEIGAVREQLHSAPLASAEGIRHNEFLTSIRQRSSIPGGTCGFDLPALHHWLSQTDAAGRRATLERWRAPLLPLQHSVDLLLRLIRSSTTPVPETAERGFFQRAVDGNVPAHLARIFVPRGSNVYPEFSGGKHRFSIRFMELPNPDSRATQSEWDVPFELACCVI